MADTPDTERQAGEPDTKEVLSVSQLNDWIASVVQDTPALNGVRCIGEVTDLHQNGVFHDSKYRAGEPQETQNR